MVGYWENDPMTTNQKLIAGVFSGVITRFMTQPMDVIKVRSQLVKKVGKGRAVSGIARRIYWEEGVKAFWQGHAMGQVHSILAVSSQFYIYEITTRYAAEHECGRRHKIPVGFFCGMISGCISTTIVIPLEVIRVRQILVREQYAGFLNGARNVYKSGGLKAFYEGLSASLLQMGPAVGISFTTFRVVQSLILHFLAPKTAHPDHTQMKGHTELHKPENVMLASSLAGAIAGFASKTITYPLDLTKKRLQIASHITSDRYKVPEQVKKLVTCKSISHCLRNSYRKEGLRGWFRGWTVTIYKAQLTSVVAFTCYEMTCSLIRNFLNT